MPACDHLGCGGGQHQLVHFQQLERQSGSHADDVTFNATGALASGTTNTVGSSMSINSLTYGIESATLQHTTAIAAGQTLAVTGNFLLAGSTTATAATNVTITGSTGTLTVSGASFQVGQTAPTAASPLHTLDMSGLATLTAKLTGAASTFRLGATAGSSISAPVTLRLANTSTITTNTLGVGDAAAGGATQTLKLGSVSNTINANLVNVGSRSGRGSGNISFDTTTGTLKLRAADGTSAVSEMNMVNNGFGHSGTHVAIVDFSGHSVDVKVAALNMACGPKRMADPPRLSRWTPVRLMSARPPWLGMEMRRARARPLPPLTSVVETPLRRNQHGEQHRFRDFQHECHTQPHRRHHHCDWKHRQDRRQRQHLGHRQTRRRHA